MTTPAVTPTLGHTGATGGHTGATGATGGATGATGATGTRTATVIDNGNGWKLVSYGAHSVAISNDGLIRLPNEVDPHTAADLVTVLEAAGPAAAQVVAANDAAQAAQSPASAAGLTTTGGFIIGGDVPVGAVRVPVT